MKKVLVLVLALGLGGCAQLQNLGTAISIGTTSIANPVTTERLYQMENAAIIVFTGLKEWRRLCVAGQINATCKDQIRAVQVYTRQIPPYLVKLRAFVRNNDQVNAIVIFNTLTDIISTVKARAAANNVQIGS
jgi:hypothetical protein